MRERFPTRGEPDDVAAFVRGATIVLDTSVLLGLYRLSAPARAGAFQVLERVESQLWIPHQVGEEFYRNVDTVRGELQAAYAKAAKELRRGAENAKAAFGASDRWKESRKAVADLVEAVIAPLIVQVSEVADGDAAVVDPVDDDVQAKIERLLAGRIGPALPPREVRARVEEFTTWRVPNQIPPGYMDAASKSAPLRAAGDYLLWTQVLDHASAVAAPMLLLTNDVKRDWFTDTRPRPELLAEFAAHSAHPYWQMHFDAFLNVAPSALHVPVDRATIEEVAGDRAEDELLRRTDEFLLRVGNIEIADLFAAVAPGTAIGDLPPALRRWLTTTLLNADPAVRVKYLRDLRAHLGSGPWDIAKAAGEYVLLPEGTLRPEDQQPALGDFGAPTATE
ncbi:PIN-like domain-containing protein [Cellulomonas soli]|uniref:PIN-like domain-containing protein n=1 Tax=Cellulomonas soli TaxID=931535 RepID=UPI003F840993